MKGEINFGVQASAEVKDLILKILKIKPGKRLSLEEIKAHSYLKKKQVLDIGTSIRCFATGYGMANGIISDFVGDEV